MDKQDRLQLVRLIMAYGNSPVSDAFIAKSRHLSIIDDRDVETLREMRPDTDRKVFIDEGWITK